VAVIGHLRGLEVTAMSASGVPGEDRRQASARRGARPDILTARVAGALFIAATLASLLSTGLLNPVFSGSDYLLKISAHQDRIAGRVLPDRCGLRQRGNRRVALSGRAKIR
jgi:hypothetical protein